ncbi:hypothetical protein BH11BAC7_BH11BAC7_13340 [soil metagenome]
MKANKQGTLLKRNIMITIMALIGITVFGQIPNWQWAHSAGGTSYESGNNITTDVNGNVLMTGYFSSPTLVFGSWTLTNHDATGTTADIFVVKYDPSGNVLWAINPGGTSSDGGTGISTDGSGNIYLTGYFSTTATFAFNTVTSAGNLDAFIAKYDSNGNIQWVHSGGGATFDVPQRISTDTNGNSYIVGYFTAVNAAFGAVTLINADNTGNTADIFIVKYDAAGNLVWAKSEGGVSNETGTAICVDALGTVLVTGYFASATITFGSTTLTNVDASGTTRDVFVAKYNAAGSVLWVKNAGGTMNDFPSAITSDPTGNVIVTGYFVSPTITIGTSTYSNAHAAGGTYDIFLMKYDPSGNLVWAHTEGANDDELALGLTADSNGDIYITGSFNDSLVYIGSTLLTNTTTASGISDMFVSKFASTGVAVWATSTGGTLTDACQGICVDNLGNLFISGYFNSAAISFGTTSLTNVANSDVFVARMGNLFTGVQNAEPNKSNTFLYPNPSAGAVTLLMASERTNSESEIKIYNQAGQLVYEEVVSTTEKVQLDLQSLSNGVYFVRVQTGEMISYDKLILNK